MDYFQGEQELFRSFEAQNGLNEGDILKAIRILDAQIADEERKQKSSDLAIASSQSVHPEVAAKFARLAGADVISGSQIKEAKPILQRMSKTLADPNLPEDVKQASLDQDKSDLEQITFRSVTQGGKQGIAVTGKTAAGRTASDIAQESSGAAYTSPEGVQGAFFPEPEKPAYQQETEQFMQTLEPESTVLGGVAGQQDIAQKKARNDLRKAEFLARHKTVALGQGQQLFEVGPGGAKQVAEVPPKPIKAEKGPTTIEAALLQPGLTEQRKNELLALKQALKGKGLKGSITLPDGTQISIGEPTPAFKTQIQKETLTAQKGLQELIALKEKVTPESFGITSKVQKAMQETFEFIAPGSTPKWAARPVKDRDKLFRQAAEGFALRIKELTGVQFGEKEADRLAKSYPNADDNFAEFNNKMDDIIDSNVRSIARLMRFGIPVDERLKNVDPSILKNAINAVPLGAITQEEIDNVKQLYGMGQTGNAALASGGQTLTPDLARRILQASGGNKNAARQMAKQLGYTF